MKGILELGEEMRRELRRHERASTKPSRVRGSWFASSTTALTIPANILPCLHRQGTESWRAIAKCTGGVPEGSIGVNDVE